MPPLIRHASPLLIWLSVAVAEGAMRTAVSDQEASAVVQGLQTGQDPSQTVVPYDQEWRFHAQGQNLGTAWRAPEYDDAAWPAGPGPLGFPITEATPVPLATVIPRHSGITYYFLTSFVFDGEPADTDLVLSNFIDDGAVFYLNNTEALRVDMPPAPGIIDYLTPGGGGEWVLRGDVIPGEALVRGTNLLAVEVHQDVGSSSDMVMGLHLLTRFAAPTPLVITNQPQSLTVEERQSVSFAVGVEGRGARYQWFKNGAPIPGESGNTLVLAEARPFDAADYHVVASNTLSMVMSDTATLTVMPDITPPRLVEARETITPDGDVIDVIFSEAVSVATATNLAHYLLQSALGAEPSILVVEQIEAGIVRITTEPLAHGENHFLTVNGVADQAHAANIIAPDSRVAVSRTLDLFEFGSAWNFYDPVPGLDPPLMLEDWKSLEYPVENWGIGAGAFLSDSGAQAWPVPANTILTAGNPNAYFRKLFDFPGSPLGARLHLGFVVDDGAVFHIEGVEVHRWNMPGGIIAEGTPALDDPGVAAIQTHSFTPASPFRHGTNLLTAELHRAGQTDIDRFFGASLKATVTSLPSGPVIILSQPASITVVEGSTARFVCRAIGGSSMQWLRDGTPLAPGGAEELVVERVPLSLDGAGFSAVINNDSSMAVSQEALLTVLPDTAPPEILSAVAGADGQSVHVTFSEFLDVALASVPGHYELVDGAGTPLAILGVTTPQGNLVILETAPLPLDVLVLTVNGLRDAAVAANPLRPGSRVRVGTKGVLLLRDALWSVENSGVYPGPDWMDPARDNLGWPVRPGVFGHPLEEALPPGWDMRTGLEQHDFAPTYYFRVPIRLPTASGVTVTLTNLLDDGAVFHVNGQEAARVRMPFGPVGHTTVSSEAKEVGTAEHPFDVVTLPGSSLVDGTNTLAVELHNQSPFSPDAVFGCEVFLDIVSLVLEPLPPGDLTITREGPEIVLAWDGALALLEQSAELDGSNTVWTEIPGATSPHRAPIGTGPRFYRLRQ